MLVGRTGLSPVMVGRAAELDRLVGLVGVGSVPTVALVAGEAGIGKTRLIQELVNRVPAGTLVLAGQADPSTLGRPMELFLDAAAAHLGAADPELAEAAQDPDRSADERVRAGVELVRGLVGRGPALIVFEDLHWADSESVTVFERLAEPEGHGTLLVGTYRPDALSRRHPTAELLPRLERRHSVTHLHLDRLSPAEVSGFLTAVYDQDPSFRVVDELHSRTGGNPFFLEELVASSGQMPGGDVDAAPLPWTVSELVRAEVDELPDEVRELVSTASVLGRRVLFDLLSAVTGLPERDLIGLLRIAVERGLLLEVDPDVFSFRHELAREAIQSGLLGRERRRLHEAAFDALRKIDSRDHVELAHHARGAGRYDDMVAEARLGAHEALERGSSYKALQMAETGLAESEDDFDLLAVAVRAAWLVGLADDAIAHCDRWLKLARTSPAAGPREESAALQFRTRLAFEVGDIAGLTTLTEQLVELLDRAPDDEERARIMAEIAHSAMLRDLIDEACDWADRAIALAEPLGLDDVRLHAMVEKGSALIVVPDRAAESCRLLEQAADEAERRGHHVLAARALSGLTWQGSRWREPADGTALIERMRAQAVAAGYELLAATRVPGALAHLAAVDGDLHGAIEELDRGRRATPHRAAGWGYGRWTAAFRAGLALEAGDVDGAACYAEQGRPVTERNAQGLTGLDLHIACRRGDLERARQLLPELVAIAEREGFAIVTQVHDVVSAALDAGLTAAELRPLVERAGHYVGGQLQPGDPWHELLEAQLAEAEGRIEEAAERYAAAAPHLGESYDLIAGHRAAGHLGAARCLLQLGRTDEARRHADSAAEHLGRWGGWRVDQLRAVQRRLGLGPEPSGPDALTPREREVVALLAEGLTNAQLAERLFISPRTAAVHVSNVLTKLAMSSRTEVAAWAVRNGLT